MRSTSRITLVALAALAASVTLAAPKVARAQALDVTPPLPNVMILLDTSGSMEKMTDGKDPEVEAPCDLTQDTTPNRWGAALEALTGHYYPHYRCAAMPRQKGLTPTQFELEYQITTGSNTTPPYDLNYSLAFHRPATGTSATDACVYAPGVLGGFKGATNAFNGLPTGDGSDILGWPTQGVTQHLYTTPTTSCKVGQFGDGTLDSSSSIIRWGLMTFDSDPLPNTGVTSGGLIDLSTTNYSAGLWSYFHGWNTGAAASSTSSPFACSTTSLLEIGGRNPAAPAWEGRLMTFPDPNADALGVQTANDHVQTAMNAMRPYGATPIAGMMADAQEYFWSDTTGPQQVDPYVKGLCRDEYIILITDGAPNLDLRPQCSPVRVANGEDPVDPGGGICPFHRAETTAATLYRNGSSTASQHSVPTFVIGFAVSSAQDGTTPIHCADVAKNGTIDPSYCDPTNATYKSRDATAQSFYKPCCALEQMAVSGGTQQAYFADTQGDLQKALGTIVGKIGRKTTTRTTPAYSPAVAGLVTDPNTVTTAASLYLSTFQATPGSAWTGDVVRQRFQCQNTVLQSVTVDATKGDDFQADIDSHAGKYAERRYSVVQPPAPSAGAMRDAAATIRPYATAGSDGLPSSTGAAVTAPSTASVALSAVTPDSLGIPASNTQLCGNLSNTAHLSATDCKNLALNFAFAQATTSGLDGSYAPFASRYSSALADIFHSTPTVVGPPGDYLRDESYEAFRTYYTPTPTNPTRRPTVLYTATNDGLLHAFDTGVAALENNELWALMPPAVMPSVLGTYPANHTLLLDGAPVTKDVVWDRIVSETGDFTKWHTMLVSGFGSTQAGYYAVDITDPRRPEDGGTSSFRWQVTKIPNPTGVTGQYQLFGQHGATPAIGTVFVDLNDGRGKRELGVAFLPGGSDSSPSTPAQSGGCQRDLNARGQTSNAQPLTAYTARGAVRCWGATGKRTDPVVGRSMTVVRIDTGEVIRTFARLSDLKPTHYLYSKTIDTPLDSPMTGTPALYPAQVGSITRDAYAGDADGTLWRFDLHDSNPNNWVGELFFDTENGTAAGRFDSDSANAWNHGQPIAISPIVSLDSSNNVVVTVATGDQDLYAIDTKPNWIYSLTEKLSADIPTPHLRANVNWYLPFQNGERVTGPMAVFDGVAYFATFRPQDQSFNACNAGLAFLWGRDFVAPDSATDLSVGGLRRLQQDYTHPVNPAPASLQLQDPVTGVPLAGKIIPGVSVNVSPSCASIGAGANDAYVSGAKHYAVNQINGSPPTLLAQIGGIGGAGNGNGQVQITLPPINHPTRIDSWAAVVE